ncbi:MAG: DUF417 family protein [Gemmatimonadaceae bacterium]
MPRDHSRLKGLAAGGMIRADIRTNLWDSGNMKTTLGGQSTAANRSREDLAWIAAARVLGLVMVWFGLMRFFPFDIDALGKLLAQYSWLPPSSWAPTLSIALGASETGIGGVLLFAPSSSWRMWGALAAALFWGAGLLLLFGPAAWVHDAPYDGFPVIGSGQTLLKHVGIASLGLGVFARLRGWSVGRRAALYGLWLGQLLVLIWIGLMKFTRIEALGIEPLMRSHPLFAWLYGPLDVQSVAIAIAGIELTTAGLIALWPWRPEVARWGLLLVAGLYVITNSFLITLPGWQAGFGFPFVGGTGQFLLKDLLLLAGALILLTTRLPRAAAKAA